MPTKTGLDALLRPEDSVLVLIDHQPYQFANLHSHEPTMIVNNVIGLAKTAKVFNVPTILTTVIEERGGYLIKGLQDVFPDQKPIDRTFINTWQDKRVVDAVKATGRKQLLLAALWTEICLAMPALQALADGYDVFIVTDASGGVSAEAHDMAVRRMVTAGAVPMTWLAVVGEWQRDWAREKTAAGVAGVVAEHGGGSGVAFAWTEICLAFASPSLVFLPSSEQTERKTRPVCPEVCPDGVPKTSSMPTIQSPLVVAFSVKGDDLNGGRLHRFAVERFRVSVFVSYTCRCAVRWPRG